MGKLGLVNIYADKDLKTSVKNIKCPLHHTLKPGLPPHEAYEIEPNPLSKHFTNDMCKTFGLRRWRYKRDRYGQKIPNYRNHFQPEISAMYAKERIFSAGHPVCVKCRRCFQ
jgi:hypothetical protein